MTRIADLGNNKAVLKAALEGVYRRNYLAKGKKPTMRVFDFGIVEAWRSNMAADRPWMVTLRTGQQTACRDGVLLNREAFGS